VLEAITTISVVGATATAFGIFWKASSFVSGRREAIRLQEQPNIESAVRSIQYLDSEDNETCAAASYTIGETCEISSGPGKIVKNSNRSPEEIVDLLVDLLDRKDEKVRANAAMAIKWFSRDYAESVVRHEEKMFGLIRSKNPSVASSACIIIGNLGYSYPDKTDEYIDQISHLVDDEDPDIRIAVVHGLGCMRPTERSVELLKHLHQDPNPEVRQEAENLLDQILEKPSQQSKPDPEGRKAHGDERDREFVQNPPDKDFSDIAGMEEFKQRLREDVIKPLSSDEVYDKFNVGSEDGILFHGPPGTGKTHMSECLAGELGVNYVSVDVGDIDSKYLGEGTENIKRLFEEAFQNQPCLIFIDELDAIAADRSLDNQHQDKKKMVNQLLQRISDVGQEDEIIVIGATNNIEGIDDAMVRTGRFNKKIHVPKPDSKARWEIFNHYMDVPKQDIQEGEFITSTQGFTASDIEEVARRAARNAAGREMETGEESLVTKKDVYQAIEEVESEAGSTGEFIQNPPNIDFEDVVGMGELKDTLREKIIEPIENPEKYEKFGLSIENGFLLYGPPGTGKTHIAKCLAGELQVSYINAKAGDLVSKWIGEGAQNVQQMFDEARQNQPCIIFIDEVDALATSRGTHQTKSEQQMVNQFLEELTEVDDGDEDVIVIAATNLLEKVDDAMLRTGRLSEQIRVSPPDTDTRISLIQNYIKPSLDEGIDWEKVSKRTEGMVASDMEKIAEESARNAMKRWSESGGSEAVMEEDILKAIEEVAVEEVS
jgi:SpoVK/Ycf46/Vps4 family AAA+-type ATPase